MTLRHVCPLALLIAAAALVGCARTPPQPVKTSPPVVIVDYPIREKVNDYEDFAGRTEPVKVVELKSRVTGYLKKINFKDGEDVEAGKNLFDIDPSTYKAEVDKAEAALNKAEKHLITANYNWTRVKQAYETGAEGKEKYDLTLGDKLEAEADVGFARASLKLAETNLRYCNIVAPFSGRISKRLVDEGNLVKADETSLTTIVKLDEVYTTFDVDERTVMRVRRLIQKGQVTSSREQARHVQIALADDDEYTMSALLTFSDNQVDAGTGTLRVRATLANPKLDRAPWYFLSPGQFVRVRLPIGKPREAILVPEKALGSDQGQRYLFVVNAENRVERRNVRIGQQYGQMRVVQDNVVSPSDRIIVDGLLRVRPGVEVTPKPASKQPAAAPSSLATPVSTPTVSLTPAPLPHLKK